MPAPASQADRLAIEEEAGKCTCSTVAEGKRAGLPGQADRLAIEEEAGKCTCSTVPG
jgi:hypothetical protein